MRGILLIALLAGMLTASLATLANDGASASHASYSHGHCDLRHGSSKVYASYTFHDSSGIVVGSSWDRRKLATGQKATKSHSGGLFSVKIHQRTPYNTYVTVASKSCWGGF